MVMNFVVKTSVVAVSWLVGMCSAWACTLPERLNVVGNAQQHEQVCAAYGRAVNFFERYGYTIDPAKVVGQVSFANKVILPAVDSKGNPTFSGGVRVLGLFDRGSGVLQVTDERDRWVKHKKRTYFKLQYTPSLYESVLVHELVHMLSKQFYRYSDYGHAQEEYIAYAAQIESLSIKERDRVLKACDFTKCTFSSEVNINDLVHFGNPHRFGVMSYRHFSSPEGGRVMLERIYSGDFKPIDFSQFP